MLKTAIFLRTPVATLAFLEYSYPHPEEFQHYMLALGIIAAALLVVLALLVYALRRRIKFAIVLIKEGSR